MSKPDLDLALSHAGWSRGQAIAYEAARECITALMGIELGRLHET